MMESSFHRVSLTCQNTKVLKVYSSMPFKESNGNYRANIFHFLPVKFLSNIIDKEELFFQPSTKYEKKKKELDYIYADGVIYRADELGVFCFTQDQNDLLDYNVWKEYGAQAKDKCGSVCVTLS